MHTAAPHVPNTVHTILSHTSEATHRIGLGNVWDRAPSALLASWTRRRGHKLSHVVAHVATHLRSGKTRNPFAYLRSLIQRPVDYAFLNQEREASTAEATKRAYDSAAEDALLRKIRALAGTSYQADVGAVWTVEG